MIGMKNVVMGELFAGISNNRYNSYAGISSLKQR
jgi:hypothetical protein